jgi:protein TonB
MPRDLFGDVTRPSISIGNRKWYTVPVSLLSHAAILLLIVIAPILAAPLMPGILDSSKEIWIPAVMPDTPKPPPRRITEIKPVANPHAAPVDAPTGITKEPDVIYDAPDVPIGVIGVGDGVDTALAPPVVIAAPPPKQEPVKVGGTIRNPMKLRGSDPVYPTIAQAARVQGIVILEATLSADGRVTNARILRSVPLLDQAALDAVRTWEYTPTMLNGVAVPVIMTVTVTFTLSR